MLMDPYEFASDVCRAMLCKRGLCHHAVSVRVCLSVCVCRVLSLSDRRYSLNPLSQTRID